MVREACRNARRTRDDPGAFLHLQRSVRKIARLGEHHDLLRCGGDSLHCGNVFVQKREYTLSVAMGRNYLNCADRRRLSGLHLQNAADTPVLRSDNGGLRIAAVKAVNDSAKKLGFTVKI